MYGMKYTDSRKVRNHWVDCRGLWRAPRDSRHVVQRGMWRGHAFFRDFCQVGGPVENEGGELEVVVCEHALEVVGQD